MKGPRVGRVSPPRVVREPVLPKRRCLDCWRQIVVRKNGALALHRDRRQGYACPGSGKR